MKHRGEDWADFIGFGEKKPWYRYSLTYCWWTIQRIAVAIARRPLCLLGVHGVHDGIFHTRLNRFEEEDIYKCYHCRHCNKPADRERHDQRVD